MLFLKWMFSGSQAAYVFMKGGPNENKLEANNDRFNTFELKC